MNDDAPYHPIDNPSPAVRKAMGRFYTALEKRQTVEIEDLLIGLAHEAERGDLEDATRNLLRRATAGIKRLSREKAGHALCIETQASTIRGLLAELDETQLALQRIVSLYVGEDSTRAWRYERADIESPYSIAKAALTKSAMGKSASDRSSPLQTYVLRATLEHLASEMRKNAKMDLVERLNLAALAERALYGEKYGNLLEEAAEHIRELEAAFSAAREAAKRRG